MSQPNELRINPALDYRAEVRSADDKIKALLTDSSRKSVKDLAHCELEAAGLTSAQDLYYFKGLLAQFDAESPLQDAPLDVFRACTSQGHAMAHMLASKAEAHLLEGLPISRLTREWAEFQVKALKQAAAEARRASAEVRQPTAVLIGELEMRNQELQNELDLVRAQLEEALTLLESDS